MMTGRAADVCNRAWCRVIGVCWRGRRPLVDVLVLVGATYVAFCGVARCDEGGQKGEAESLLRELRVKERDALLSAVRRAGSMRVPEPRVMDRLVLLLDESTDDCVAKEVETSLVRLGPPAVSALLSRSYHTSAPVDVRAFNVIHRIGKPAIPQLVSSIERREMSALGDLALTAFLDDAIDPLMKLMRSQNPFVRESAVSYIVGMRLPRGLRVVREAARKDPDSNVRESAVLGLAYMPTPEAISFLRSTLRDRDRAVRVAGARALGHLGHASALKALASALGDEAWEDERAEILSALGGIKDERVIAIVRSARTDKNRKVRIVATGVLARAGVPGMAEELLRELASKDEAVRAFYRAEAARQLGLAGCKQSVASLGKAMDEDRVAPAACEALGRIGGSKAGSLLMRAVEADLGNDSFHGRMSSAVFALQSLRDARAVPVLIRAMQSHPRKAGLVCGWAAMALGRIGGTVARKSLSDAVKSDNVFLRFCAVRALGNIGDDVSLQRLREIAKSDCIHIVRQAAMRALRKPKAGVR